LQMMLEWSTSSTSTGTNALAGQGTGQDSVRETINAIRFTSSSANITAGTVTLYGIS